MNVFTVQHVTAAYPHTVAPAVREISFTVTRGSFTAIIGPNGSGKSTLLRVVLGALPPSSGSVRFEDKPLNEYSRSELAKRIGAVTQIEEMPFPITVRELVSTGRYVHLGAWRAEREEDRVAVQQALERCELTIDQIDCIIPHQANRRIIEAVAERLDAPWDRVFVNVDRYGNTSAASVAIALDEAVREGRIRRGDLVLLLVFGAGLTWGAAVIEW